MSQPVVRTCYKQHVFVPRIQQALGVSLGTVRCHIVDRQGMSKVMQGSGWSKNETHGVVGFQVDNKVYVLDDSPWSTLHELVHRAGINADRLNRFVAEGLTEAIARELKQAPDEHRPTYPTETQWVQTVLLPKLGLSAVQLGQKLATASNAPRALADLLVAADPSVNRTALINQLQPQKPDKPSLNCRGCRTRVGSRSVSEVSDDGVGAVAGVLLVSGLALALPELSAWWSRRRST